ncbi:MAG: hypothetical protein JRH20_09075 [Deltaproteobacteria bacterium]|nr:hypothetical protein [Deltaproteobacteria bacterium]
MTAALRHGNPSPMNSPLLTLSMAAALSLLAACPPNRSCTGPTKLVEARQHLFMLDADPEAVTKVEIVGDMGPHPVTMHQTRPGHWEAYLSLPTSTTSTFRYQFRVQHRDGSWRTVSDPLAWQLDASHRRWSVHSSPPPRPRALKKIPRFGDLVLYELSLREMVVPQTPYADRWWSPKHPTPTRPRCLAREARSWARSSHTSRLALRAATSRSSASTPSS